MKRSSMFVSAALLLATAGVAQASFTINVNFGGGLTPSQQTIFSTAAGIWQSQVTGYQPGVSITGININASGTNIDGPGGILGSAGPSTLVHQGGYWLASAGNMNFDTADLANMESNGSLLAVILHEMGHVMGIGTLWDNNGLYVNNSGQYTGAFGLAAYQSEFNQPGATFVPVELGGGGGTANGHWDEPNGGGAGGPLSSISGLTMHQELMTGWLNTPYFISSLTLGSLRDMGFAVVPTPGAAAALAIGGLAGMRRRR